MNDVVSTSELVNNYSSKFLDALPDGHSISSPLGLWVLLSLMAPSLEGKEREEMEAILGAPAEQVSMEAQQFLSNHRSDLLLSVAFWFREQHLRMPIVDNFLKTLPASVEVKNSISQEYADRWVDEKTSGIIGEFPVEIDDDTALIFASALAAKIKWRHPFKETAPITSGKFAEYSLSGMVADDLHYKAIFKTSYGYAGVHMAEDEEALKVYSIIVENPELSQKDAKKAALEIISGKAVQVSLFDLPLGDSTPWNIRERVFMSNVGAERREEIDALVASWSAETQYDLQNSIDMPGVSIALEKMKKLMLEVKEAKAIQSAKAKYGMEGFEAAAVTVNHLITAPPPSPDKYEVTVRSATIKFDNPYTVVATVRTRGEENIPAFIAWVETPSAPE